MAVDSFKAALSLSSVYGSKIDFKFSYFEDLIRAIEAVRKSALRANRGSLQPKVDAYSAEYHSMG